MTTLNIQLVQAIFSDNEDLIKSLSAQGVDLNDAEVFTIPPLIRAVIYNKPKALKTLLDCGANQNITNRQGKTLLQLAQEYNHPKIVEILLQN